jgi:hypothetical protein
MIGVLDRIRQNHGLEHATVTVMLQKLGMSVRLAGRSTPSGFYLYGDLATDLVEASVHEALRRMQAGEGDLAVSPLCGTNLAVGGILASAGSFLALGDRGDRRERFPRAVLLATCSIIAAQPIGRLVQKHVTTSPDQDGVEVISVTRSSLAGLTIHKVRTRRHGR